MRTVKLNQTRDQKVTFDYYFEESMVLPKKHMLSVEAVRVMPSVTGCYTLSTPIGEPIPDMSDGITSRFTFAGSFKGANPKKQRSTL